MKKRKKEMDTHLHIRIDAGTLEYIRSATHSKGTALSDFVRQALQNEIKRMERSTRNDDSKHSKQL